MSDDPLVHVSRPRYPGASCRAKGNVRLCTALADSNCVACWCFWYGTNGEQYFLERHGSNGAGDVQRRTGELEAIALAFRGLLQSDHECSDGLTPYAAEWVRRIDAVLGR